MSTRVETVMVCDYCGKEGDDVVTQEVTMKPEGALEVEACEKCWHLKTAQIRKKARRLKRQRASKKKR